MTIQYDNTNNSISVVGTDANIDLNLTTKGTGAVKLNTGGGEQVRVTNRASANLYVQMAGGQTGIASPSIGIGGGNSALDLFTTGGGTFNFYTNGNGNSRQVAVTHTASAVNYFQLTGAATGGNPAISTQGSDSNIGLGLQSKGTAAVASITNSRVQFDVFGGASSVNYIRASGANAGSSPSFSSLGTDTDIDLTLTPKGTGNVRFGTYTASMALTVQGYIEVKDAGGTVRKLAVIA
jgi:hypothetical protein